MKLLAFRRFNYIDLVAMALCARLVQLDHYLVGAAVLIAGAVISVFAETIATYPSKGSR